MPTFCFERCLAVSGQSRKKREMAWRLICHPKHYFQWLFLISLSVSNTTNTDNIPRIRIPTKGYYSREWLWRTSDVDSHIRDSIEALTEEDLVDEGMIQPLTASSCERDGDTKRTSSLRYDHGCRQSDCW